MENIDVGQVIKKWLSEQKAFQERSRYGRPQSQHVITLTSTALGTAAARGSEFKIGFPFKAVYVRSATDSNVQVSLVVHSKEENQVANAVQLKLNDQISFEEPVGDAYLIWPAQTGKTMTLIFFVDADFRSGQQISVSSGGVSVTWGDTNTEAVTTLTAVTAGAILASNSNRKHAVIQNNTGADLFIGSSSSVDDGSGGGGANIGVKIPAGQIFEWKSTAALYGYSVAGGTVKSFDFS